ncbi:uncharacterized protein LOC128962803 [Oppia nitens]|uniref:uncharacterized protein LOC128962803 n=1 Tax=Oppia nitens TaxID=1686743 RepID=UPI0023DBCF5E|nr:uncharacterized protein LOC128962803 [Oppia nitens]
MKDISCQIALLVLVLTMISVVIIESKKFCQEFMKNDNKIDFAFRYYINNNIDKLTKEYRKYLFIGNTYWKLTFIDGKDKTVTIDDESTGQSNWLSGYDYSMAWSQGFDRSLSQIGALRKNMKSIDWVGLMDGGMNLTNPLYSIDSEINFANNFQPIFAWIPIPLNRKTDYLLTFWDNKAMTQTYNITHINRMSNVTDANVEELAIITGEREKQVNKLTKLMTIMAQYSHYDYDSYPNQTDMRGQGSLVFMYVDTAIKYCYVGIPFNELACKSDNLKTLIDCSPTKSYLLFTVILIVIGFVLFIIIIGFVCYLCCSYYRQGRRDSEVSISRSSNKSSKKSSMLGTGSDKKLATSPSKADKSMVLSKPQSIEPTSKQK